MDNSDGVLSRITSIYVQGHAVVAINETADSLASSYKTPVSLLLHSADIKFLAKTNTWDNWQTKRLTWRYSPHTERHPVWCFVWELKIRSLSDISTTSSSPEFYIPPLFSMSYLEKCQRRGFALSRIFNDSCYVRGNCQVIVTPKGPQWCI